MKITLYRTTVLPAVYYGCETWSITLKEERGVRPLENRVLRKIFGSERGEVTGELHNEELYDMYSSPNIWVKNEMGGACGTYGRQGGSSYRVLVGRPEGKRPLGRPRHRWRVILKWIFKKWDVEAWTGFIWFRTGTESCECGNEPSGSVKCGEFRD